MYYYDVTDETYERIPQVYLNNIENSFLQFETIRKNYLKLFMVS